MTARLAFLPIAVASTIAAAATALAAPQCLANGKSFQIGEVACLIVSGKGFLARCETVLNNTSWTRIDGICPQTSLDPTPPAKPTPAPNVVPAEPTEN